MRGNHERLRYVSSVERSIPACAGEPSFKASIPMPRAVYPRVCGGTHDGIDSKGNKDGLSPRVRGNHRDPPMCASLLRSIPACAGEPNPPTKVK